jgi:hypothetical protein
MKHILIYEDYDYFYPENDKFCIRKYDNKIFFIINDYEYLPIGNLTTLNSYKSDIIFIDLVAHVDWDVDKISTPHKMTLSRISEQDLNIIIETISKDTILKIENITNFDLTNYIKKYIKIKKARKFNL